MVLGKGQGLCHSEECRARSAYQLLGLAPRNRETRPGLDVREGIKGSF